MKSPFPGMDPYIEACGLWEGFHSHLIDKIGLSRAGMTIGRLEPGDQGSCWSAAFAEANPSSF
jgi:Protein of unknown function (DUF4058)